MLYIIQSTFEAYLKCESFVGIIG